MRKLKKKLINFRLDPSADIFDTLKKRSKYLGFLYLTADIVSRVCACVCVCVNIYPFSTVFTVVCQVNCYL